jgi:hypothetical protein
VLLVYVQRQHDLQFVYTHIEVYDNYKVNRKNTFHWHIFLVSNKSLMASRNHFFNVFFINNICRPNSALCSFTAIMARNLIWGSHCGITHTTHLAASAVLRGAAGDARTVQVKSLYEFSRSLLLPGDENHLELRYHQY